MKEENYENEAVEEIVEGLEEITEEEMLETTGGAGGYGDIEFECECGANILSAARLVNDHLKYSRCKKVKVYFQKCGGKKAGHRGRYIGIANVKYSRSNNGKDLDIEITYPSGKKATYGNV